MQGAVKSQSFEPHVRQIQLSMFRHSSSYLWWITATNSVGESDKSQTTSLSTAKSGGNRDYCVFVVCKRGTFGNVSALVLNISLKPEIGDRSKSP